MDDIELQPISGGYVPMNDIGDAPKKPTRHAASILQPFRPTYMEWLFQYDHLAFGFRSPLALTTLDVLPGVGILAAVHTLTTLAGVVVLSVVNARGGPQLGYASCVLPRPTAGQNSFQVMVLYLTLCMMTFFNVIQLTIQHRCVFYDRRTAYQARKLEAPGACRQRRMSRATTLGSPKSMDALWDCFFAHLPAKSFMISYNWAETELPRSLVAHFPTDAMWIDVQKLMPGTPITAACAKASADAHFRFVFLRYRP
jgi:hypothetical protein